MKPIIKGISATLAVWFVGFLIYLTDIEVLSGILALTSFPMGILAGMFAHAGATLGDQLDKNRLEKLREMLIDCGLTSVSVAELDRDIATLDQRITEKNK